MQRTNEFANYIECGSSFYEADKYNKAISQYTKAIEIEPDNAIPYYLRGRAYYMQEIYKEAIEDCTTAIKLNPASADSYYPYYYRAKAYKMEEMHDEAIVDLNTAIELDPTDKDNFILLAEIYFNQNKFELAISEFTKAIALDPESSELYCSRAEVYCEHEKFDEAILDLNTAIKLDPTNKDNFNRLIDTYLKQGNFDQAISEFTRAIALEPENTVLYLGRAEVYYSYDKFAEAILDYNKVISLNPNTDDIYICRGDAYLKLNQFDEAILDYNTAIQLDPSDAVNFKIRGDAYFQQNKIVEAIADYAQCLILDPDNTAASEQMNKILDNSNEITIFSIIETLPIEKQVSLLNCRNEKFIKNFFLLKNNNPLEVEYHLGLHRHRLLIDSTKNKLGSIKKLSEFDQYYFDERVTQHVEYEKLWMLLIDGQDHKNGRLAYDKISEAGYIDGCETAAAFIFRTQDDRITPDYISKIHHLACTNVKAMNENIGLEHSGNGFVGGRLPLMHSTLTLDGLKEMLVWYKDWSSVVYLYAPQHKFATLENADLVFKAFQETAVTNGSAYGEGTCKEYAAVLPNIKSIIDQYYLQKEEATNEEERRLAVLTFYRKMEVLHAFSDGNGRTARLIMLKELLSNKLPLACLSNPSIVDGHSIKEIDIATKEGTDYYLNAIKPKTNDDKLSWFDHGNRCMRRAMFDEAITAFTEAIKLDPSVGINFVRRGDAYYHKAMFAEAMLEYEMASKYPLEDYSFYNKIFDNLDNSDILSAIQQLPIKQQIPLLENCLSLETGLGEHFHNHKDDRLKISNYLEDIKQRLDEAKILAYSRGENFLLFTMANPGQFPDKVINNLIEKHVEVSRNSRGA